MCAIAFGDHHAVFGVPRVYGTNEPLVSGARGRCWLRARFVGRLLGRNVRRPPSDRKIWTHCLGLTSRSRLGRPLVCKAWRNYRFRQSSLAGYPHLHRLSCRSSADELKALCHLYVRRFTAVVSWARLCRSEAWREVEPGRYTQNVVSSLRFPNRNCRGAVDWLVDLASHWSRAKGESGR